MELGYGRFYRCPDCDEEFLVSPGIESGQGALLICPVCGSVDVEPLVETLMAELAGALRDA